MGVNETAYLTLAARAKEHRRPDSVFRDLTASDWHIQLGGMADTELDPVLENGIVLRTVLFDYAVLDFIAGHGRAMILDLGCGFSTRLYRLNPGKEVSWFHIDLPEIMRLRDTLERPLTHMLEVNLSADLRTCDWLQFKRTGGDVLCVLEGVLSYLELDAAIKLIDYLRRRFPGSTVLGTATARVAGGHLWSAGSLLELEEMLNLHLVRTWNMAAIARRLSLENPEPEPPAEGHLFEGLLI